MVPGPMGKTRLNPILKAVVDPPPFNRIIDPPPLVCAVLNTEEAPRLCVLLLLVTLRTPVAHLLVRHSLPSVSRPLCLALVAARTSGSMTEVKRQTW